MKENMENAFYIEDNNYYPENNQMNAIGEEQSIKESSKQNEDEEDEKEEKNNINNKESSKSSESSQEEEKENT